MRAGLSASSSLRRSLFTTSRTSHAAPTLSGPRRRAGSSPRSWPPSGTGRGVEDDPEHRIELQARLAQLLQVFMERPDVTVHCRTLAGSLEATAPQSGAGEFIPADGADSC